MRDPYSVTAPTWMHVYEMTAVLYFFGIAFLWDWFSTPWTLAHQAPLSTEFSRQEYWSGLTFPSPNLT